MLKNIITLVLLLFSINLIGSGVVIDIETGEQLRLIESHIDVQITNQISVVTSQQIFLNSSEFDVKVGYSFPITSSANAIGLRWKVGSGDWKEAVVDNEPQDPGSSSGSNGSGGSGSSSSELSDYLGSNPIRIEPTDTLTAGDIITMEITYVELLPYTLGIISFNYQNDYSLVQTTALDTFSFNLEYASDRILEDVTFSPEEMELNLTSDGVILTRTSANENIDYDINVELFVSIDDLGVYDMSTLVQDSLFDCCIDLNGYVSLIIEPQSNDETAVIEKNFTLIVDRSGSMNGSKMSQAIDASSFIVNNLNEGDFFNVISFSGDVTSLFGEHREISPTTLEESLEYISNLNASGSTNISGSLLESIEEFGLVDDDKVNIIIFFTDGLATAGEESTNGILQLVRDKVAAEETEIFLFTFGIGDNVDKSLLTQLGQENNGLATFLESNDMEESITEFFLKVNNPVVIGTELSFEPAGAIVELVPSIDNLPNLYKGEQLIISGKYDTAQDVKMKLTGRSFNQDVDLEFSISLADTIVPELSFLPKIWAKQKIDELSTQFFIEESTLIQDSIQGEIDTISQCYNVVSLQFNSFVDGTILSLDHLVFRVSLQDEGHVQLDWTAYGQINNSQFEIERYTANSDWEKIGSITAVNDNSEINDYQFIDQDPKIGLNYYRLKYIDNFGEHKYSEIQAVTVSAEEWISIKTNLLSIGENIEVLNRGKHDLIVYLLDMSGRLIYKTSGNDEHVVISTSNLLQGQYLIHVNSDNVLLNELITLR